MAPSRSTPELSVVVPLYDEEDNVAELYREIVQALAALGRDAEMLFVDDGSRDGTFEALRRLADRDERVRVLRFARNYGQTAAIQAGFEHARGAVLLTLDGDLQNDPADFGRLLAGIEEGYDVVSGWRRGRRDAPLRTFLSRVANLLISRITGVAIRDTGCTLKAYRREVARHLLLRSDMHRFIPVLVAFAGGTCKEIEVGHRPRCAGTSKYGLSRTWKVLLDLILLAMSTRFLSRPAQWFGLLSLPFLVLSLLGVAASGDRYLTGGGAGSVIFAAVTMLFAFAFLHLLLMAVIGELAVWAGELREIETLVVRRAGETAPWR